MINYKKLEAYGTVLQVRNQKLMKAWCDSTDEVYKKKCLRLNIRIDNMIRALREVYWKAKKADEDYQRKLDNELVLLSCKGWECQYGVGMTRENYTKAGAVICDSCGKEMLTEEEWEIKEMLWRSGIYTE